MNSLIWKGLAYCKLDTFCHGFDLISINPSNFLHQNKSENICTKLRQHSIWLLHSWLCSTDSLVFLGTDDIPLMNFFEKFESSQRNIEVRISHRKLLSYENLSRILRLLLSSLFFSCYEKVLFWSVWIFFDIYLIDSSDKFDRQSKWCGVCPH